MTPRFLSYIFCSVCTHQLPFSIITHEMITIGEKVAGPLLRLCKWGGGAYFAEDLERFQLGSLNHCYTIRPPSKKIGTHNTYMRLRFW